jgi:transposase InsO family protein
VNVARVMRRRYIRGLRLRRRVHTTIPDPAATKAPKLIGRDFTAPGVNQRYVDDITYLPIGEREFLHPATVPPASRKPVRLPIALIKPDATGCHRYS